MKLRVLSVLTLGSLAFLAGCGILGKKSLDDVGTTSRTTGEKYGDFGSTSEFGVQRYTKPDVAPGMVFVEGGTFIMGGTEENITYTRDNRARQVTVNSFYIDDAEVSNVAYKEFLFNVRYTGKGTPLVGAQAGAGGTSSAASADEELYKALLPDTTVWIRELAYNDPLMYTYFQSPAFNNYPVVGVDWYQANAFSKWRTNFLNQIKKADDPEAILYPDFRLPTEAEWEYAARGGLEQTLYPWEGKALRDMEGAYRLNFKRGRGDYAGQSNYGRNTRAEGLNDGSITPASIVAYYPNDFGLYNMSGNVAEWTYDTYRVSSYEDFEDMNPARRRGQPPAGRAAGYPDNFQPERDGQRDDDNESYSQNSNLLYRSYGTGYSTDTTGAGVFDRMYRPGPYDAQADTKSDHIKVYRGGSWADIAYYVTTGARRFLPADSAASTIGFRCAMIRVGSPR